MDATDKGLASWLKHRSIPKNRAYVNSFLAKCGLSANRPMDVILVCKGLSLNDSYWITDETFTELFESKIYTIIILAVFLHGQLLPDMAAVFIRHSHRHRSLQLMECYRSAGGD